MRWPCARVCGQRHSRKTALHAAHFQPEGRGSEGRRSRRACSCNGCSAAPVGSPPSNLVRVGARVGVGVRAGAGARGGARARGGVRLGARVRLGLRLGARVRLGLRPRPRLRLRLRARARVKVRVRVRLSARVRFVVRARVRLGVRVGLEPFAAAQWVEQAELALTIARLAPLGLG